MYETGINIFAFDVRTILQCLHFRFFFEQQSRVAVAARAIMLNEKKSCCFLLFFWAGGERNGLRSHEKFSGEDTPVARDTNVYKNKSRQQFKVVARVKSEQEKKHTR